MLTLLAVCSFCGCLIVFVCLSAWILGLGVDLIELDPESIYLLYIWFNWRALAHGLMQFQLDLFVRSA